MRAAAVLTIAMLFAAAARAEQITVAAAVSLKEAMTDVAALYATKTGDAVQFTFGSSGQLAAQIKNGAPVDLFISAATKQLDDLASAHLIDISTRRVVAGNALVLIAPTSPKTKIDSFESLSDAAVQQVAIGEPKTVPAGEYAMQILTSLTLADRIRDRLVYGTNVRQVLDYVERGEVDAGIVYATDAAAADGKVRIVATAPPGSHEPVVYPAAVVRASSKPAAAARFLEFLGSAEAQASMEARGFAPPPPEASRGK